MNVDLGRACEAMVRCRQLRESHSVEAVLRGELQSWLRLIFVDERDKNWLNHYSEGAEARAKVGMKVGVEANRFIDNLVGSTTIEYEADLRVAAKWREGFSQVKEHTAGLIRKGFPVSRVRGILSDTVDWYAYDVKLDSSVEPAECTIDDIELIEVERFEPHRDDEPEAERLLLFIRRHLAREQSRPLAAANLVSDLGLESASYTRNVTRLAELVAAGRDADPSILLATDLWSRFVDHLESDEGDFRSAPYVDEVYLNLLARLISANVLSGSAFVSDDEELCAILNGAFFRNRYQLDNLVEKDYFGWITEPEHIGGFLQVAREIQRDLYAYDFSWRAEEDLFGRLMAQLARRSQRKLLGQEWTPKWLARQLAERCLDGIPDDEAPEIIDMCCGSGAMLAEVIKAVKERYGYNEIDRLGAVVTGFDIDPLAVTFAKTTWVISLADEIGSATAPVTIPIYHADSLFALTPVSASLPMPGQSEWINVTLDGETIQLPASLIEPVYRDLFDRLIDWAYDEAQLQVDAPPTLDDARTTVDIASAASQVSISEDLKDSSSRALLALTLRMKDLARAGRNGIWAFILRNTYKPGLLAGQFNGLVSNPPWLTMSALADNPYREMLSRRAALYGITPTGQSFLHLELGTTHLLHAVDRYLKPGSSVACLVPGSILNGAHHEQFRQRGYINGDRQVGFSVTEVWQIASGTFKYPAAALIGRKESDTSPSTSSATKGAVAHEYEVRSVDFAARHISETRTAWVLESDGWPAATSGGKEVSRQGADIMPRSAVCVEVLNGAGQEHRVDTPQGSSKWGFTLKQAKEFKGERFPGYVAPRFIHQIAQSENLLPFVFGPHRAPVALPACRDSKGTWRVYDPVEIRRMGFTQTARRFEEIDSKLMARGGKSLAHRLDFRRKLSIQDFGDTGFIVLSGAGGKHICAACLPIEEAMGLAIDQTLYWQIIAEQSEAWFRTGILNSTALTDAILPFNPKGDFGPRHIHTLPYRLIPSFDPTNTDHRMLAELAKEVSELATSFLGQDSYVGDPSRALAVRRRKMREYLNDREIFLELNRLSAGVLGTSVTTI